MPDEQKNLNSEQVEELGKSFALHLKSGDDLKISINEVVVVQMKTNQGKLSCYWKNTIS